MHGYEFKSCQATHQQPDFAVTGQLAAKARLSVVAALAVTVCGHLTLWGPSFFGQLLIGPDLDIRHIDCQDNDKTEYCHGQMLFGKAVALLNDDEIGRPQHNRS
jgi:hypothetical protein